MKTIQLTQGRETLVDNEDYKWLNQWKWRVRKLGNIYYAIRNTGRPYRKFISMHREILGLQLGDGIITDHRNGNGLDNQRCNLRKCTVTENAQNRQKRRDGKSKFKGVMWEKRMRKWYAQIVYQGHKKVLGYFISELSAAKAYNLKAKELFGEFARLNKLREV